MTDFHSIEIPIFQSLLSRAEALRDEFDLLIANDGHHPDEARAFIKKSAQLVEDMEIALGERRNGLG